MRRKKPRKLALASFLGELRYQIRLRVVSKSLARVTRTLWRAVDYDIKAQTSEQPLRRTALRIRSRWLLRETRSWVVQWLVRWLSTGHRRRRHRSCRCWGNCCACRCSRGRRGFGARTRLAATRLRCGFRNHLRIQQLQHTADAKTVDANIQTACFVAHRFVKALR